MDGYKGNLGFRTGGSYTFQFQTTFHFDHGLSSLNIGHSFGIAIGMVGIWMGRKVIIIICKRCNYNDNHDFSLLSKLPSYRLNN